MDSLKRDIGVGLAATSSAAAPAVEHFGELIRPGKYGHRLTREMYALVNKRSSTRIPEHMLNDELRALLAPHYEDAEMTIHTEAMVPVFREMKPDKSRFPRDWPWEICGLPVKELSKATLFWRPSLTERTSTGSSPAATSTTRGMNCRTGGAWTGKVHSAETT